MEPFTFSEVRGFRVRLLKLVVKGLVSKGEGEEGSYEDATGSLWLDLAANTSAAKAVVMTAAD